MHTVNIPTFEKFLADYESKLDVSTVTSTHDIYVGAAIEFAKLVGRTVQNKAMENVTHKHKVYDDTFQIDKSSIKSSFNVEEIE